MAIIVRTYFWRREREACVHAPCPSCFPSLQSEIRSWGLWYADVQFELFSDRYTVCKKRINQASVFVYHIKTVAEEPTYAITVHNHWA